MDTAIFASYGPFDAPRYAMSVIIEEAGFGGTTAAPVARRLFDVFANPALLPPAPEGGRFEVLPTLAPDTGEVRD